MNIDIENFNVIITGGTRGIGKAVTEHFLKAGCRVTAVYSNNETAAIALKNQWADYPLNTIAVDVADYNAVEQFYRDFDQQNDRLDVLVNCAGIRRDAIVGMMSCDDWKKVIDINLGGTFNMSKFAVQKMMQNRFGRIISITSPSGRIGIAGQANYAAAKGGIILNPGFGIRSMFGENFGVIFTVGYRFQRLYYAADKDRQMFTDFNRLSIKIGITFR